MDSTGNSGNDATWAFIDESNDPPNKPIIKGPRRGTNDTAYEYTFSTSDPDVNNVYYYIEWGDGYVEEWIGSYDSGEEISVNHTWRWRGTYLIRVKAIDVYGAESDWAVLVVVMPKTYENPLWALFEEIFEWIEQIVGRNIFQ